MKMCHNHSWDDRAPIPKDQKTNAKTDMSDNRDIILGMTHPKLGSQIAVKVMGGLNLGLGQGRQVID